MLQARVKPRAGIRKNFRRDTPRRDESSDENVSSSSPGMAYRWCWKLRRTRKIIKIGDCQGRDLAANDGHGDRCPSLGRRAKTNKRVPRSVHDRRLLLGYLLHEEVEEPAAQASCRRIPTRRFVSDPRTGRSSTPPLPSPPPPARRTDSKMRDTERRAIGLRTGSRVRRFLSLSKTYTSTKEKKTERKEKMIYASNFTSSSKVACVRSP